MSKYTIGIDLGGTTMTAGIVNENYEIVGKLTWATRLPRPAEDLEKALADLCRTVARDNKVDFADITYREVLCKVRDMIYEGHKLLTHPLSGSVKPNETPYKSILVGKTTGKMDPQDASIIENSIITADKFSVKFPEMPDSVREDFQLIDTTLIKSALMSIPEIF